jgi:schlafen family protein
MAFDHEALQQLLNNRRAEGLYLEFKRGAALTAADSRHAAEMIKDCSGLANAAGGIILYGVAEEVVDGVRVAASVDPVTDARVHANWIAEVLRSNTSPPLTRFHVSEIPVDGGRVIAVEVEESTTAHQSLRDHKYYQRSGPTTAPMVDFQVRDVMGRRFKPDADVIIQVAPVAQQQQLHRYLLQFRVTNTGPLTLEHWWLDIDVPAAAVRDTTHGRNVQHLRSARYQWLTRAPGPDGGRFIRVGLGDPGFQDERCLIRPNQSVQFDRNSALFEAFVLEVGEDNSAQIHGLPIRWTLYFKDHRPKEGEMPFRQWSQY